MSEDQQNEIDFEEESESSRHIEPITYFGTDFDVHGLVRRLNQKDIMVPSFDPATEVDGKLAGFQRKFVWKRLQMERFIESMLLGFPVPDLFFVQQADKSLLVLDGQQRLTTMQRFYAGDFELNSVVDELKGLTYDRLDDEQRRSLDNFFIHATVIKYADSVEGAESIYSIFERLNAGGTNLHPHEIRVALHNGRLVSLIRDLNSNQAWRNLYGPLSNRLKDQEQILRFIALYEESESYERPLKSFLNKYLYNHKNLEGLDPQNISSIFTKTCESLAGSIGKKAFRLSTSMNAALCDAVMVGVAHRLKSGPITDQAALEQAFDTLIKDQIFIDAVARATADEERVRTRLNLSIKAFEGV